ncbi:MAG: DUF4347 domain-containing protein [Cellvibrio sp.]|uniref:fibronectin type III domain-containing protein n=1 Tax=Cellvibrio sp. TaxID=1965322 RepID=UPI0027189F91|nr:DUF4347 domain-containing protein [Cellvibrio sp.]
MRNTLLSGLSSLLLPLGLYSASATAGASYQRTYLSSSISTSSDQLLRTSTALPRDLIDLSGDQLDIQTAHPVRELVIVDGAVADVDKSVLRRALKPGMQLVELDSSIAGLSQLINALDGHKNLAAIHVVSHAEAGAILLGNSRITPETIQQEVHAFAALKGAVREGGDLLFYGCDLAANEAGEALLDIISNNTGLDVAASNNLTGNSELQGDWDLEVTRGNIESTLAFSEKALGDFSSVLFTGTINFSQTKNAGDYYGNATVNAEVWATGTSGYFLIIDGATRATELYTGLGSSGQAAFTLNTENSVTLRFNNNEPFSPQSLKVANIAGGGGTTHSFTFTSNKGSFAQNVVNGTPATIDLTSFGANVTYITISSTLVYAWMDDFSVVGVGITVDETAPVFQNATPSVGSQTLTGATLSADLDEEGTVYYVVVADGAGAPSAAQVLAGQNSSGAAALTSGNFTTTTTTGSEAFSGLSAGTNYDLYVVAQDDEGSPNVQASATLVNFTTQGTDSDATLTAAGGVAEPIGLATTIDSVGEAVDVFDFTITDGGTSDGLATTVSQIVANVSGTSTDAERGKITWRLNGPDASNVTGTYSAGADTITFSGLSISVADGGNETYTVNAYYNDNTALTEDRTIILSVDGDTNLTVGGSGTQMASGQSAVTNGSGTTIDVVVSQLVFTTQPAGSVSGAALTTQPVVRARDAFGNTDVDFTETITLTEASAGTLTNGTQAATAGVATFTSLTYTATADQQAFTLTANDQDGVGSNLSTVDANSVTSDVVATKLLFTTQPAPTSVTSGAATNFSTVPVVSAADANDIVDTGYSTGITLAEVNGAGSATMTGTGDADGNGATVSITPSSGVSTFTGMQITYTNSGAGSETFNLRASSGGLTTADSSQLTADPTVPDAPTIGTATAGDGQVDVTFTAPGSNGGSAITTYTATANPGGAFGTCAGPAACTATVSGLSNGTAYTFTVTATNAIGTSVASGASNSATPKADQIITFANPGAQNFGTAPNLSATSDSGLTVTFTSSTTGVCTVSGVALTFVTAGTCTIDADQAGDASTNAATTVTRSFTVNAIVPDAPTIGTATAGDTEASVSFVAPASAGGAAITGYTVTSNPGGLTGTGAGSPVTVTGLTNGVAYTFTVTATNSAGTGSASGASNSITPASPQTITFANPGAQNFGTSPTLSASSSAGGGYVVTFTSSTPSVCTVSGTTLTFLAAGTCTINADQAGDSSFLPASQVSRSFSVNPVVPGAPTIGTAIAGDTQASVAFVAPVNIGGSAITGYIVTVNPADVAPVAGASSPIVVTGLTNGVAYTFTVTADNVAGTGSASAASNSVTPAAIQTITFANPGAQNFGTAPTLSATADSGLTPVFTSSTPAVCTITGVGALTFVTAGTCTINADQAGNGSYLPATQVIRSFSVDAVVPGAPTAATASAGNAQAAVSFSAPAFTGGVVITSYTVTANPGGATAAGASSPITVTGLTNGTPYTFTVTATNSVGAGVASTASAPVTPMGTQTITFGNPGTQTLGTSPSLTASASSGLTPVFSSATTGVCTITSGGALTLISVGTCTIEVNQAGNASYQAAPEVSRSFNVEPALPGAPTAVAAVASDASATVTFIAPVNNGGSAITGYTVTASPGGITATGTASPISVTGLTNGTAYSFRVSATNAAGTGTLSTASNTVTPIGEQTISLVDPGAQVVGGDLTLTATASSGLTPVFTSSTLTVCTVTSAGVVTLLAEGTCTLSADQAGNASFDAAPTVSISFTVAPLPNQPPVISQGSEVGVTMSEDGAPTAFALVLDATDNEDDTLIWSLTGPAQHGSATVSDTGSISYTPTANYNGSDSLVVQVSDGENIASITVNITIEPVNDLPVISGTPALTVDQDVAYSFTPSASDVDTADVLTFSIINKPTWASFNTTTGALTGTPANADAGISGGIVISVSDGTASAALPAFDIEVIATIDPLQPIVTAPADLELNATALFTPVTLRQLLGIAGDASQAQVDQILNAMASDGVSGNSCCTTILEGLNSSNALLLAPGRHQVKWKATNAVGVSGEATQIIDIKPLVSLSKSQLAVRGSEVEFRILLNGSSPVYPFSVPYVINTAETTATAAEHNLVSGTATFTQAGQVEVAIPVTLPAVTGFSDSVLVVALGSGINAGAARHHVIEIRQGNIPPVVSLSISQGGVNTSLVTPNGGPVTVSAQVNDANVLDTHTFDWSATSGLADTDGNPTDANRSFDPTNLTGGHQVQVTVTDSAGASVQAQVYFRVIASLPVLDTNTDTDQDGISDELEGAGDTDNNGIPDYLDNMPSPNILPQQGNTTNSYLIECDPGVRCGLGLFARGSTSGGVQVLDNEVGSLDDLIVDPAFEPVGGIFDFTISDLPTPGQSVRVVIPQQAPIPANAVYRKFKNGAWVTFVSDADNALHSAAGNPGYCPPPGTPDWTSGLTAGHLCVQLTLEDGGPNDDDGLVNSAVVDPGAVSEAKVVEPPPPPPKPPVQVNSKGGGAIPMLWLLVLGGLVLIRRAAPARWAAIAIALFSINTQAMESAYLRVDVYMVNGSQSEADFNNALTNAGHEFTLNRYEEERSGYQLAVGYQWSELTYSEVGYLDLGDVEVGLTLDGDTDLGAFANDFADNYPVTATGATLVQGLSFKAGSAITLSAEAGVFIWKGEVELDNAAFSLQEDDGIDPLIGARIDVALVEGFSLGLSGRRIFFNDQDVDLLSVSGVFRF